MLPIYYDVKREVKAKAREILTSIIKSYFIFHEDSGNDFSYLFPETIYYSKKEKCELAAKEIELWSRDRFERELSPLHEHALYKILLWANDIEEDYLKETHESLFFSDIPNYGHPIIEEEKEDETESISDINISFYLEYCFRDYDFLDVHEYVNFIDNSSIHFVESKFHINLNDYRDLMPVDIENKLFESTPTVGKSFIEAENFVLIQGNGEVQMQKKTIDISNSTFGDNSNFLGDKVKQNKVIVTTNDSLDKAFEELFKIIDNSLISNPEKQQANYHAQELQTAIQERDKSKAKLLHSFLINSLGSVSSLLTIGQFISEKF